MNLEGLWLVGIQHARNTAEGEEQQAPWWRGIGCCEPSWQVFWKNQLLLRLQEVVDSHVAHVFSREGQFPCSEHVVFPLRIKIQEYPG